MGNADVRGGPERGAQTVGRVWRAIVAALLRPPAGGMRQMRHDHDGPHGDTGDLLLHGSQDPISVSVDFGRGMFTEWYPQSRYVGSSMTWDVEALPGEAPRFPRGGQSNHYYEARATDAVPLRAGTEAEKLIFYRGIGELTVPVRAMFTSAGR